MARDVCEVKLGNAVVLHDLSHLPSSLKVFKQMCL